MHKTAYVLCNIFMKIAIAIATNLRDAWASLIVMNVACILWLVLIMTKKPFRTRLANVQHLMRFSCMLLCAYCKFFLHKVSAAVRVGIEVLIFVSVSFVVLSMTIPLLVRWRGKVPCSCARMHTHAQMFVRFLLSISA